MHLKPCYLIQRVNQSAAPLSILFFNIFRNNQVHQTFCSVVIVKRGRYNCTAILLFSIGRLLKAVAMRAFFCSSSPGSALYPSLFVTSRLGLLSRSGCFALLNLKVTGGLTSLDDLEMASLSVNPISLIPSSSSASSRTPGGGADSNTAWMSPCGENPVKRHLNIDFDPHDVDDPFPVHRRS